jgi:hypothetical protein
MKYHIKKWLSVWRSNNRHDGNDRHIDKIWKDCGWEKQSDNETHIDRTWKLILSKDK